MKKEGGENTLVSVVDRLKSAHSSSRLVVSSDGERTFDLFTFLSISFFALLLCWFLCIMNTIVESSSDDRSSAGVVAGRLASLVETQVFSLHIARQLDLEMSAIYPTSAIEKDESSFSLFTSFSSLVAHLSWGKIVRSSSSASIWVTAKHELKGRSFS